MQIRRAIGDPDKEASPRSRLLGSIEKNVVWRFELHTTLFLYSFCGFDSQVRFGGADLTRFGA